MLIITKWEEWLKLTVGGDPYNRVSERIGKSPSTVGRWTRTKQVPAEGAIAIAREYGGDPVAALLASGWITPDDLRGGGLRNAVANAPTIYLTEELHLRITQYEEHRKTGAQFPFPFRREDN